MNNKSKLQAIIGVVVLVVVGATYLFNMFTGRDNDASNTAGSSSNASSSSSQEAASAKPNAKPSAKPSGSAKPSSSASDGSGASGPASGDGVYTGANPSDLPEIAESKLPKEGRETLTLIRAGGPYPYDRDGIRFGNFEGILPDESNDFYKEYTVKTPGSSTRGAKRIVVGETGVKYYTDDHYESFSFIKEGN